MTKLGMSYKYGTVQLIPIDKIQLSQFQVRQRYGDLSQLARDIEKKGLLYPILVRPLQDFYEIVHGHRRFMAVKSLGRSVIEAFVKELSDADSVLILGSENLQRKNFDDIEEALMYQFYQNFIFKESNKKLSFKDISEAFETSPSNVETKMGLLDLPESIQDKIIKGEITTRKARPLITLTREDPTAVGWPESVSGEQRLPRTDRFYSAIESLVEEIEKGTKGGIRTSEGVQMAVDAIKQGKPLTDALEEAKLKESIEISRKRAEQGKKPEEIINEILSSQQDPQAVLDATIALNIKLTQKLLKSGTLKCPYCGKIDCLHWSCKDEAVVNGDKES